MEVKIGNSKLVIAVGDITEVNTDAIVNAANSSLLGGGGVDGAIHRCAGPDLLEACKKIGGCPAGNACITPGFNLPAKWIIHTVGPIYKNGLHGESEILASSFHSSLILADQYNIKKIAFPAISTGVYGYPMDSAADISLSTIAEYLRGKTSIKEVKIILFSQNYYNIFSNSLSQII